jgi:hypothetical protein
VALVLVVLLPALALAEQQAPTEAACRAATRNFLGAVGARTGAIERDDLLRRFVDARGFAERAFGQDLGALSEDDQRQVMSTIQRFLSRGLLLNWTLPEDVNTLTLKVGGADGPTRSVSYMEQGKRVVLVWRRSLLVDFGGERAGLMSALLRRQRAQLDLGLVAFARGLEHALEGIPRKAAIVKSKDNIRTLIMLMISRRTATVSGGYPRYSGKNFILSLVATNQLDRRNKANLEVLFSPADKKFSLKKAGVEAFKDVTKLSLKEGKMSFSNLTSYAGRRNGERAWMVTPDQEKVGTPLVADLSFPDVAIVGFTNGSVKTMTRKELGLSPDDAIIAGDHSKSELLQKLSSD